MWSRRSVSKVELLESESGPKKLIVDGIISW